MEFEVNVRNGFYIGDICYALKEDIYRDVWCSKYNCRDGSYTDPETRRQFGMVSTAFGDGCYPADNGGTFGVDAGNIGVVDLDICRTDRNLDFYGYVVEDYTGTVTIEEEDGIITISWGMSMVCEAITIYTGDYQPDFDEEDE